MQTHQLLETPWRRDLHQLTSSRLPGSQVNPSPRTSNEPQLLQNSPNFTQNLNATTGAFCPVLGVWGPLFVTQDRHILLAFPLSSPVCLEHPCLRIFHLDWKPS